ncbi:MAG TPA: GLUG motif-containing protein, partial [Candidatus Paceibacterota bacterium]|nr:GLUG motif-containing protein [Candidatus Paceibacterota bacterium]
MNCYSKSSVSGDSLVGGLVGWNYRGNITNSYSTGTVIGNKKVGGLVGLVEPTTTTTHSYWDKETSGIDTSVEGTGRSTAEMLSDTTYLNNTWDFVCEDANGTANVWAMLDGMNDGYPILAWQYEGPVPTQETLPEVTGQGSVTVSETPTAQDICGDPSNGTTDEPLTYESEGTYTITWTYEDSQGNTTTQEQTVTVSAPDGINELEKAGIN